MLATEIALAVRITLQREALTAMRAAHLPEDLAVAPPDAVDRAQVPAGDHEHVPAKVERVQVDQVVRRLLVEGELRALVPPPAGLTEPDVVLRAPLPDEPAVGRQLLDGRVDHGRVARPAEAPEVDVLARRV